MRLITFEPVSPLKEAILHWLYPLAKRILAAAKVNSLANQIWISVENWAESSWAAFYRGLTAAWAAYALCLMSYANVLAFCRHLIYILGSSQ